MAKNKFWQFRNQADSKVGELLLYGIIESASWWGDELTPKSFKKDLDALGDIEQLNVYVNSEGGDVFAGQAIRSMLKRHKAYVTGYVDGLAASAASLILTGCDKVIMPANAMQLVHNAWTVAMGNSNDFRKIAEDLDKIGESVISAYQEKTGLNESEIKKIMDAETLMTAAEAVELGFADEIEEQKLVAACLTDGILTLNGQKMDLSRYKNAPRFIVTTPEPPKNELDNDQFIIYENAVKQKKSKYQEVK